MSRKQETEQPMFSRETIRMCVGCRRRAPQQTLLRLGITPEAGIGLAGRPRNGRGAYVCPDLRCLQRALHKGGIGRALRCSTPPPAPMEIVQGASTTLRRRLERLSADPCATLARARTEALLTHLERLLKPSEPGIPGSRHPVDVTAGVGKVSHRAQTERRKGGPASAHG